MSTITMAELARLAGVSPSTVSRALSDSPLVKPATRARIKDLATQFNYQINSRGANLRKQESGAIGLVIPLEGSNQTVSDPFFLQLIGAVADTATIHGMDLVFSLASSGRRLSRRELLSSGRADGLIVVGQAGRHERLNALAEQGAPIVVWGAQLSGQRYVTVGSDNLLGGTIATQHLLERGCRRIAFLGDISLPEVGLRYRGFREAHLQTGIEHMASLVLPTALTHESAALAIRQLIARGPEFDGIFAASDLMAFAALKELQRGRRNVPGDVRVVGYDDVSLAAHNSTSLTTVSQDIAGGGQRLVDCLLEKVGGRRVESSFTETQLMVRESS